MNELRDARKRIQAGLFLAIGMCLISHPAESAGPKPGELDRALIYTAREGDLENMKEMIDRGADINATMAHGWTALSLAKSRRYSDIVDLLEKAGAKDPIR